MSKKAKKIAVILLTFATLMSLASCASPYTDDEAREILAGVLDSDIVLAEILWGKGLETEQDPGDHTEDSTFYYMEVSPDSRFTSLDELKAAARETYSKKLYEIIESSAFGREDRSENEIVPRYAETDEGFLQIDVTNEGLELHGVAYIGESKIVRASKKSIKMDIKVSLDGGESFKDQRVVLVKQDGVWKLDTQLWCIGYER